MKEYSSTDEKIIKATFAILQRDGFTKATTKKIAAEAGVNEVTIFRNFKNKTNLVELAKEYYLQKFINQLEEIFDFEEDEGIDEYLKKSFYELLHLEEEDFSIIRVALEEVRETDDKKSLISEITDAILNKMEEFFKLKIEKGEIRQINPKSISVMNFGILFQSLILWKIYNLDLDFDQNFYGDDMINILYEGLLP